MIKRTILLVGLTLASANGMAASAIKLQNAEIDLDDKGSLQRGAALFMNYCVSCHSAKYMRFNRIALDLGLSETQVMQNLNFLPGAKSGEQRKFGETIESVMSAEDGTTFFGKAPPDLSLTSRTKAGGANWIYTYLTSFYQDPSRPSGWNNTVLPNASMPNVLWELQGVQALVHETAGEKHQSEKVAHDSHGPAFEMVTAGKLNDVEFKTAARDISAFMAYIAEPSALKRKAIGPWVILYLAGLTFLAWLLKQAFWTDVH